MRVLIETKEMESVQIVKRNVQIAKRKGKLKFHSSVHTWNN